MKKVIRLTESDLHSIVKEAVNKILIKEYGDKAETREKMGRAAKRGVERGDSTPHENAINSLIKRKSSRKDMEDFQKGFEE
jgi:hypothetical protein